MIFILEAGAAAGVIGYAVGASDAQTRATPARVRLATVLSALGAIWLMCGAAQVHMPVVVDPVASVSWVDGRTLAIDLTVTKIRDCPYVGVKARPEGADGVMDDRATFEWTVPDPSRKPPGARYRLPTGLVGLADGRPAKLRLGIVHDCGMGWPLVTTDLGPFAVP